MTAGWVLGWWNLIYVVPFGLALLYLGLYTLTGIGGDADADSDVDADADVNADADVDAEAEADVDADAHVDADAEVDADADTDAEMHVDASGSAAHAGHAPSTPGHAAHGGADGGHGHGHGQGHAPVAQQATPLHLALLAFVGVGRAPLGLVLMILLMTWGFIGFATNNAVRPVMPRDWMVALVSLPLAAIVSVLATGGAARLVSRLLPTADATSQKRRALCGCVGEAVFEITSDFGTAMVRDGHGNRYQVACRVGLGRSPIPKGERVLLIRYDAKSELFDVIPDELGRAGPALRSATQVRGPDAAAAALETDRDASLHQERGRVTQ